MYYEYSRWYDPSIGRFISQDTYPGHLSDPQSLNYYTYTENSPTGHTDPTGHFLVEALFGALIGAGVGYGWCVATTGGWTSSACGEAAAGGAVVGALAGLTDGLSLYAEGAAEVGGATACEVECSALIDTGAPNDATTGTISSGAKVEPTITSTTSSDITTTTLTENVGNDLAQTSTGLSNAESESNFVPNPYGKLGGPLHQGVVSDIASDISSRDLYAVKEFQVGGRFADVAAFDRPPELGGSPMEFYQVGRLTSAGLPVAREIYAAGDIIDALGIDVIFVPYNV